MYLTRIIVLYCYKNKITITYIYTVKYFGLPRSNVNLNFNRHMMTMAKIQTGSSLCQKSILETIYLYTEFLKSKEKRRRLT